MNLLLSVNSVNSICFVKKAFKCYLYKAVNSVINFDEWQLMTEILNDRELAPTSVISSKSLIPGNRFSLKFLVNSWSAYFDTAAHRTGLHLSSQLDLRHSCRGTCNTSFIHSLNILELKVWGVKI